MCKSVDDEGDARPVPDSLPPERHELTLLIDLLESQRAVLGEAVAVAALAPLRAKLAAIAPDRVDALSSDLQKLRQVTILFLDIVGSTQLSRQLDPEDIHAVVDTMLAHCTGIVGAHLGKVLQYAGDSVLAVFGADETREDDAERAIHAGLALLAEGRRHAGEVRELIGDARFAVRVGIHTGPVLLGGGVDSDGSIRGLAVNIAARMEQSAPPGALRISRDTYRHVRGVFDVEPQPPLQVKGLDEPMATFVVLQAKPRAFRDTRRGIEGIDAPMVGRDRELRLIEAAFEDVVGRNTLTVLTVVAEAGLGKSRLVAEFEQWIELRPERVWLFRGRAHPQSLQQPYGVLRELLCWRFEIQDSDTLEQAQAKLAQGLAPVFGDRAEEQTALLGQLIGLDYGTSPHIAGIRDDGKQLRARAFHAGAEYFRLLSGNGPVTLLLDDLQWADEGSLDFIGHLAKNGAGLPILMLCAARPALYERRPGWGDEIGSHQRIELGALGEGGRRVLADALLARVDDPPAVLRELLTERADGNPFYMEELTLMLIDSGVITAGPDRWQVAPEKLLGVRVPTTLTGVLQARIDVLSGPERAALQQASVIGPLFWDEALAELNPQSPQSLPALGQRHLVQKHETSAFERTREFAFGHHLLHQVTYDGVLKRHKREQHRITALWLERRCAGRSGEYLSLLAEHFERAGAAERAAHYWTAGAKEAMSRFADDAALAHSERALALEDGADPNRRFALMNVRESVFARQHTRAPQQEAIAELERLAELTDDDTQRTLAAQRRAWFLFAQGSLTEAIDAARRALAWAGPAASSDAARAHNVMLAALARMGRFAEAREQGLAGLAVARAAGQMLPEAHLLSNLGNVAMESGNLADAGPLYEQALDLFRREGSRSGMAVALGNLANLSFVFGQFDKARAQLDENLRLCNETGNRGAETSFRHVLASVLLELDEPTAALAQAQTALPMARAMGDRSDEGQALCDMGLAHAALGQWEAAREHLLSANNLFDATGMTQLAMQPRTGLVRVALATGDLAEALVQANAILDRVGDGQLWKGEFAVRLACWQALARCGDPRAAATLAQAHADLSAQAKRISDPGLRASFLGNVSSNRRIIAAWEESRERS